MSERRGKLKREGFGPHGIEYDHRFFVEKVKKTDYYDQNEMHVLLMRWREARIGGTPKDQVPKLLRELLWHVVDGYMNAKSEKVARLKYSYDEDGNKEITDVWEDLRIKAYEHLLKVCSYYSPEKIPEDGSLVVDYRGNLRKPKIRVYYFFLLILRQITKYNLGQYYGNFGKTGIVRSTNDFYEAMYGWNAFDNGGRKVGISAHTEDEMNDICMMARSTSGEDEEEYE